MGVKPPLQGAVVVVVIAFVVVVVVVMVADKNGSSSDGWVFEAHVGKVIDLAESAAFVKIVLGETDAHRSQKKEKEEEEDKKMMMMLKKKKMARRKMKMMKKNRHQVTDTHLLSPKLPGSHLEAEKQKY